MGLTPATIEFLHALQSNNDRAWFEAHKSEFKRVLQAPMQELGREVFDQFTAVNENLGLGHRVSRIYRDARRVRDGKPYHEGMWFSIEKPSSKAAPTNTVLTFWFDIHPDEWSYGLGFYAAQAATMAKLRAKIDADPVELERLIAVLDQQNEFVLDGPEYARVKPAPTAKTQAWYNKKSLSLIHLAEVGPELFDPGLATRVATGFNSLVPAYTYLSSV